MNRRKSILETIRKSNRKTDTDSAEYRRLKIIVEVLLHYFEIYDIDNGTVHSRVFEMLYLSAKYYTYNQICEATFISKNTLVRYVAKYEKLALRVSEQLNL